MNRILIVKTSALGDIIHAFPVIGYLKAKFSQVTIDWVVEKPFAPLIEAHPYINHTFPVDTKAWRKLKNLNEMRVFHSELRNKSYDVVFDLQGNIKSGLITSRVRAAHKVGFGKESVPEWPNHLFTNRQFDPPKGKNIREDYLHLVQSYFKDWHPHQPAEEILLKLTEPQIQALNTLIAHPLLNQGPKVMICPGSAWINKQLTPKSLERLVASLRQEKRCSFLFIWGSPEEHQIAQQLHQLHSGYSLVADKMALPLLQHVMNHMDLIVAMDSLPLHLAGTTQTQTLSYFGPSSSNKYKPLGNKHIAFQGSCPYGQTFEKRCTLLRSCKTGQCIRGLSGTEILKDN